MKPDFVLLNPKKGIIIVEVKDWNLESKKYINGGYVLGNDGRKYRSNPITQVENYKDCILKMDWEGNENLIENYNDYYAYIETVVFFYKADRKEVEEFCYGSDEEGLDWSFYDSDMEEFYNSKKRYTKIWTIEETECIKNNCLIYKNRYPYALVNKKESKFNENNELEHLVQELSAFMSGADYHEERREPMVLTSEQKKLAELKKNTIRRWKGVAGSGKSLILAEKATKALKEDKKVLLLTYNITLKHYLRDLCSVQFGTDSKDDRKKLRFDLVIAHFHGFLKELSGKYGIKVMNINDVAEMTPEEQRLSTLDWIKLLNEFIKKDTNLNKYDYILIDEGQDFEGEWILFLKQFFTKKGEILVVYDEAQDIYGHGVWIEDPKQIKNIGFKGQVGKLRYSRRMPKEIINKIELLRKKLNIDEEEILIPKDAYEETNFLSKISWINEENESLEKKMKDIWEEYDKLIKNRSKTEDITILTTNENTGIKIVKYFNAKGIAVSHVYDMDETRDMNKRRKEKYKFVGGTGRLKVCSFQSYKGWQTPNVILVLDDIHTKYEGNIITKNKFNKSDFDFGFLGEEDLGDDFGFGFEEEEDSGDDFGFIYEEDSDKNSNFKLFESNSIAKFNNQGLNSQDSLELNTMKEYRIINDAIFISMSRVKETKLTGEYAFICLNYLNEYRKLEKYFD